MENRFIRYLLADKVDLILLMTTIALLIKDFERYSILLLIGLYILGVMLRMGVAFDNLNEYVTDKNYRKTLKLHPFPGVIAKRKKTIFAVIVDTIFYLGIVTIFTLSIV